MPLGKSITSNSFIRQLPMSAYRNLENLLDPGEMWTQLMENIPQYLDDSNSPYRYTVQDGLNIRTKSQLKGRSPTVLLLEDWGTQNPQIRHLIEVLRESELYAAADYLSVNVLKGSPVSRGGQSTFSHQCTEPTEQRSIDSCDSCWKISDSKPEEPIESSLDSKCETANKITSLSGSIDSKPDPKSLKLIGSPPTSTTSPITTPTNEQKCEATENDETEQVKEKFKKIDMGDIPQEHCPRIAYDVLKEMTDNFNDKDIISGGRLLGSGGFGSVYLGVRSDLNVAVKRLFDTSPEETKLFETELQVLSKFQHENLVSLLGYSCGPKFCLVYTYMVNGSLEDRLACKNDTLPLVVQQRIDIAKGTAQGIHYLNSNNVIHRDIKSANVLLDEHFLPKVGDFATARKSPKDMTSIFTRVVTGTAAYLAPEAYQHEVSVKLDSYSYGVVLLELLTGLPVFDYKRDDHDLKSHISEHCDKVDDIYDFVDVSAGTWPKHIIEAFYNISMKCLYDRKKRRATIADIMPEMQSLTLVNLCDVTSTSC
uniref:non-specific serine/threonine protein kinase n=1 Tax=Euprymna scolopes TaxID=6613 RepID=Q32S47_EUPSC|nr:interleukin-1-receptor-associated kinase [Euprymna scolopes]